MEIVDVLCDDHQSVGERILKGPECMMGGIRGNLLQLCTSKLIESPNEFRIPSPRRRRGHLLDSMLLPQPISVPEGANARLLTDACTREDHHPRPGLPGGWVDHLI